MKRFLKFIVSIIVIVTMVFTVYFLLENGSKYIVPSISGDGERINDSGEQILTYEDSNDKNKLENSLNKTNSGDNNMADAEISGEIASGDVGYSAEEIEKILNYIKNLENKNRTSTSVETKEDRVGIDIIGVKNKDFFTAFNLSELTVTVQTAGSMVYIIPNSDFLDNVQYHYDENGNLALYVRELIGVGGEIKYYFKDNKFIKNEILSDENIQLEMDDSIEILKRAKLVYDKYIK